MTKLDRWIKLFKGEREKIETYDTGKEENLPWKKYHKPLSIEPIYPTFKHIFSSFFFAVKIQCIFLWKCPSIHDSRKFGTKIFKKKNSRHRWESREFFFRRNFHWTKKICMFISNTKRIHYYSRHANLRSRETIPINFSIAERVKSKISTKIINRKRKCLF